MKKPIVAYCPADANNEKLFTQLQNSLRKFHSEEELPLIRYTLDDIEDPHKWYKATPLIAKELLKEYETVIKFDADQIILGDLSDIWKGEFDVATVLNDANYPIQLWDIKPYYNNGLVVLKSQEFAEHWYRLCQSEHFLHYQFREQDLLNILCSDYHNYNVRCLDQEDIYGEWAKPYWALAYMDGDIVRLNLDNNQPQLKVIHFGGGNAPDKGNYRIRFNEQVVKKIEELIK